MSTVWDKKSIQELLSKNPRAVERAIVVIYNNQTSTEQRCEDTIEANGVGFSGAHARSGTYYANWILAGKHLNGKHLEKARNMAMKYHKQLIMAIKEKN